MKTVKEKDIKRSWHLFDAKDQILGRLSSQIAQILMGKNKTYYTTYLDTGDNVVVINAARVNLSGKKETKKVYYRHSGFPGGLKSQTAAQVRSKKPEELIRHAVTGMLPKNKLGRTFIKKLYIYPGSEHPHSDKFAKISTSKQ